MNITAVVNLVTSVILFVTILFLFIAIRKKTLDLRSGIFIIICNFIILLVTVSNVLEHSGLYNLIDKYEEYLEILIIPFFLLFIYSISAFNEIEKRKKNEGNLKASLIERETLLREIHHRVKNNIQIISSLLQLQLNGITDEEASRQLHRTINRVNTLGLVHKELYQSEMFSFISIREYIISIIDNIKSFFFKKIEDIQFVFEIENIELPIDIVIPVGLIINEIVTNSIIHGFKENSSGEIGIVLKKTSDEDYLIEIYDTGSGIPDQIDLDHNHGLGMQLLKILNNQLNGEISLSRSKGTSFTIIFKNKQH